MSKGVILISMFLYCPHADHRRSIRQQLASRLYRLLHCRFHRHSKRPTPDQPGHSFNMLTEAYMEAQLVDEESADLVWECWDAGGLMI